ncbi:MAG: hypothetical protein II939_15750 [Bacteroidales bacterium]|nr:hypothetical protein [Bacteroidales bacterium]
MGTREDFLENLSLFKSGKLQPLSWSIQAYTEVGPGDYCFFLVQGTVSRGIFGRGEIISEAFIDDKWDESGKPERYVKVRVLNYVDYEKPFISLDELYEIDPTFDWKTRNSGRFMNRSIGQAINNKMRAMGLM